MHVKETMARAKGPDKSELKLWLEKWKSAPDQETRISIALDPIVAALVDRHEQRAAWSTYEKELEVIVDRERARYGAWYEIFPRSEGTVPGKGGTFKDCEQRLPAIRDMGFDVLYLTPIHPIGETNRKGRNNSLKAKPGDPGSPWAIGSRHGGHDAVEPALGTIKDFDHFQQAVRDHGMEVALDFAIKPRRIIPTSRNTRNGLSNGRTGRSSMPKTLQKNMKTFTDLISIPKPGRSIWQEIKRVILFWIEHGVKIFRVDNPHTKPVIFWEWLIGKFNRNIRMCCFSRKPSPVPK